MAEHLIGIITRTCRSCRRARRIVQVDGQVRGSSGWGSRAAVLAGIAISGDATRLYVANSGGGTVSVIDTATNSIVATIDVGQLTRASRSVLTARGSM